MINEVVRCNAEKRGHCRKPGGSRYSAGLRLWRSALRSTAALRWLDTQGSAKYLDMAQQYQHLRPAVCGGAGRAA